MVQYKLHYFNGRGRAEVIRLIFVAAGVEYEDIRISREEWPNLKSSMPLGQMPVLEVDGVKLCQSGAISRYLANQYGLAGKSEMEKYWVDAFREAMEDIGKKYPFSEKDEEKKFCASKKHLNSRLILDIHNDMEKAELKKQFFEETGPDGLKQLEKLYREYNDGASFLVGEELTVADLTFISFADFLKALKEDIFDCVPDLVALDRRLREIPNIKAWIERRPQSEF